MPDYSLSSTDGPLGQDLSVLGRMTAAEHDLLTEYLTCEPSQIGHNGASRGWTFLPAFIKPLSLPDTSEDIEFLLKKGVLSVPCDDVRDEILNAFLQYCYPYMPVLNLNSFFSAIAETSNTSGPHISLLLFHAVMFAGSMFADLDALSGLGFPSRQDACRHFYQKAKVWNTELLL